MIYYQIILFDLYCTVDYLCNDILITIFYMIGINGNTLKLFKNNILKISSSIKLCDFSSDPRPQLHNVPKCSDIDPILFSIYIYIYI